MPSAYPTRPFGEVHRPVPTPLDQQQATSPIQTRLGELAKLADRLDEAVDRLIAKCAPVVIPGPAEPGNPGLSSGPQSCQLEATLAELENRLAAAFRRLDNLYGSIAL